MLTFPRSCGRLARTAVALLTAGCLMMPATPAFSQSADDLPDLIVPPAMGWPMSATPMDLDAVGYLEEELFLHGTAGRYRIVDSMADAVLIDTGHAYTTRVLVRRPADPQRFNGTVIVEWLNVSLGQDVDFVFGATRDMLVREGYAWVGVSAQRNGVEAMKRWNADRYAMLDVAAPNDDPAGGLVDPPAPEIMAVGGDVLAWDIFSDVARLARGGSDLLGGLTAQRVIAAAESQSTLKVSTYYNSIQPLHQVYDGFFFYDRSGRLRTNTGTKSIAVGTEIFTVLLQDAPQNDNDHQRWWEINGASHFSLGEIVDYVDLFVERDAAFPDASGAAQSLTDMILAGGPCNPSSIYSRVPNDDVLKAALHALNGWIAGGPAPANAPRYVLQTVDSKIGYVRDASGMVLGGIRTAAQDAPMSRNAGVGNGPFFCGPSGNHVDFTQAEMCALYGSAQAYVDRVRAVTDASVRDGHLLPADAEQTVREAQALTFQCPAN